MKLVRVKDPQSGAEYTTGEVNAKNRKLTIIDKPATDDFGRALPAKRQAPAKASTQSTSTGGGKKENS